VARSAAAQASQAEKRARTYEVDMRTPAIYLAITAFGLTILHAPAAAPPTPLEPRKGFVTSGLMLSCSRTDGDWASAEAQLTPLNKDTPLARVEVAMSNILPLRWQVGHGAIWIAAALSRPKFENEADDNLRRSEAQESLHRYELAELLKGRAVALPGAEKDMIDRPCSYPTANDMVRRLCRNGGVEFDWLLESDILPVGPYQIRQFVLCNVRGKIVPRGSTKLLAAYTPLVEPKDRYTPHWSLKVHRYRAEWDRRRQRWKKAQWVEEESLPVVFKEPFQVLGKGDDYFFVTRSGKLYLTRKPARGQQGKMELLWDKPGQRIFAMISDADSGRSFLFCRAARLGGKRSYFELNEKASPVLYDPASVKEPNAKEPLRTVLHCARVLAAQKKIKATPDPKVVAEPQPKP
jgi:hypothetical protein